jgi:ADP-ribose pyrophosphatase
MARQIVYTGRKIKVAREDRISKSGQPYFVDVILHPGAVAILPLVSATEICLLRNERPVLSKTLWEIPAGTLEPGEAIESAAVRELEEETGYRAGHFEKLTAFYPSPGCIDEITHVFVARDLTPGPSRPEIDENLHPETIALSQALAWVRDGTIQDAKTIIALLWWTTR